MRRNSPPLARLFEHLLATDPDGAWVAEADDGIVAIALAHQRGDQWFLGFLFVLPEWQGRDVGRGLLEKALDAMGASPSRARLGVCVEAAQPIATALYARWGMVPRVPLYLLTGRLDPARLAGTAGTIRATPFASLAGPGTPGRGSPLDEGLLSALGTVDRAVLGIDRPADHGFWRSTGRIGLLFGDPTSPSGYGYVQPSGRVGPVVVREPGSLLPALRVLTGTVPPPDGWQIIVPGPAGDVLRALLDAGLRIDGGPVLWCGTWVGPPFDRTIPMQFALV
jgi:GNAT superfamily N-acetyltransferase